MVDDDNDNDDDKDDEDDNDEDETNDNYDNHDDDLSIEQISKRGVLEFEAFLFVIIYCLFKLK